MLFRPSGRARVRLSVLSALAVAASLLVAAPEPADADTRVRPRKEFTGRLGVAVAGAPAAVDTTGNGNVNALAMPASATITSSQVPAGARPFRAFLYWTGSFDQPGDACAGPGDDTVSLRLPDGSKHQVTAQQRRCSDGGAASYDVHSYRANVSKLVRTLTGTFTFDDFSPRVRNRSSDNASFALVVVYHHADLPVSTVVLADGLVEMVHQKRVVRVRAAVGDAPFGELTYYTVAGNPSTVGKEFVRVVGVPGKLRRQLSDALNPRTDPMNHTVNVAGRDDTIGMDLDRFGVTRVLTPGDEGLRVVLKAASDKWWLVFTVVRLGPVEGAG